jgi:8-oxo-dGTP pyrophosphatase MutT (NUDIX family)
MAKNNLTPWKRKSRKTTVDNPWLKIHQDTYELPNGKILDEFYIIEEPAGVNIVPITENNEVILMRQYRAAVDAIVYDFPAGFVEDNGTSLLYQAKRELREETGYASNEWYSLGKAYALPNRVDKFNHCFLARNATLTHAQELDETEFVDYELMPLEEVKNKLTRGKFTCGVCMSSFLLALLKLEELDKKGKQET